MSDIYFEEEDIEETEAPVQTKQQSSNPQMMLQTRKNVIMQRNFAVNSLAQNLLEKKEEEYNYSAMKSVIKPKSNEIKKGQVPFVNQNIKVNEQAIKKFSKQEPQTIKKQQLQLTSVKQTKAVFVKNTDLYFEEENQQEPSDHEVQIHVGQQLANQPEQVNKEIPKPLLFTERQLKFDAFSFTSDFFLKPIQKNHVMRCSLIRRNKGIFQAPEYDLLFQGNQIMNAQKQMNLKLLYNIKGRIENYKYIYLGHIISNISRNKFDIIQTYIQHQTNQKKENTICTIQYQDQLTGTKKPKRIFAYIPNIQIPYYPTQKLTEFFFKNPGSVKKFVNKRPIWNKDLNQYTLNFYGRASIASIKNFLLVQNEQSNELPKYLFGKQDENIFNLDIRYPLNIMQAFGLALSTFDFKINL